jgi:hypothetical protein
MACPERQDALQDYAAGELKPEAACLLEEHVRACPACARDLAAYRLIIAALPQVCDPPLPDSLHAGVLASIRPQEPAWRQRETRLHLVLRRAATVVLAAAFGLSLSTALWGWLGRIASTIAVRAPQDLLSFWNALREVWQVLRLLADVARMLQPALVGLAETLRRSAQPFAGWGPFLLGLYAAGVILGGWLCWRAIRQANERGWRHAA